MNRELYINVPEYRDGYDNGVKDGKKQAIDEIKGDVLQLYGRLIKMEEGLDDELS